MRVRVTVDHEGRYVVGVRELPDGRRRAVLYRAECATDVPDHVPDERAADYLLARPGVEARPPGVLLV